MPQDAGDGSRTVALTVAAMIAFAANSLLCRLALEQQLIDAASFTAVRVLSGAVMLALLSVRQWRRSAIAPDWKSVAALSGYMVFFSFAYRTLTAGTGALLLFGAVQLTMFAAALSAGERFSALAWTGLGVAFAGLIYLVLPGLAAPDPAGAFLMTVAGVAWGAYSLAGRGARNPLLSTARNFVWSVPVVVVVAAVFIEEAEPSASGLLLAVASGALASGLGYALWYAALRALKAGHAATVQLSVPLLAAAGGVAILGEPLTWRLGIAALLTIGGIWLMLRRDGRVARS